MDTNISALMENNNFNRTVLKPPLFSYIQRLINQKYNPNLAIILRNNLDYYSFGVVWFRAKEWGIGDLRTIPRQDKKIAKAYGSLMQSIYNICKELHAVNGKYLVYKSAGCWLGSLMVELILFDTLETIAVGNQFQIWNNRTNSLRSTKEFNNPYYIGANMTEYAPYIPNRFEGLKPFINLSKVHLETTTTFRKKYWIPFIEAHRNIVNILENDEKLNDVRLWSGKPQFQVKSKTRAGRKSKYSDWSDILI